MPIISQIFILLRGIFFAYIFILGVYLIASKRSVFSIHGMMNKELRTSAGWCILCWAITYLTGFVLNLLKSEKIATVFDPDILGTMIDMFVVPVTMIFLQRLIQRPQMPWYSRPYMILIPATATIAYGITGVIEVFYVSCVYWALNIAAFSFYFLRKKTQYQQAVNNNYSNLVYKELKWTTTFFLLLSCYLLCYALTSYWENQMVYLLLYALNASMWTYAVWHVDHQELLPSFWNMVEVQKNEKEQEAKNESHQLTPEEMADIEQRLNQIINEQKAYLSPNLTLTALAQSIDIPRLTLEAWFDKKKDTFFNYINSARVDYAANLIVEMPGTPDELLAEKSGFSDVTTLLRIFTDRVGCSPSQYAKYVLSNNGGGGAELADKQ